MKPANFRVLPSRRRTGAGTSAFAQNTAAPTVAAMKTYCAGPAASRREDRLITLASSSLKLTESQKTAFDAWRAARADAHAKMRSEVCAVNVDPRTLEGRVTMRTAFLKARLDAMQSEDPRLLDFYHTLGDRQRAIVDGGPKSATAK